MIETVDQLGNKLKFNSTPKRIVSVVPSQTELLFDLGLENAIVAITKFCIHPEIIFKTKTKVGGTKQLNLDKIKALCPDLIIANKEENDKQQIEELKKFCPVWISDIYTLEDAKKMISVLAKLFQKEFIAHKMINEINLNFSTLSKFSDQKKVCYLIWNEPIMVAGKNTFINEMLVKCGLENVIDDIHSRYPELSIDTLKSFKPDYVFLSSEPFPFKNAHLNYFQSQLPNSKVILVDGEFFSWYGSRLINACNYFKRLMKEINS